MDGLRQLRTVEDFAAKRGLTVPQVLGFDHATEKREHKPGEKAAEAATEAAEATETGAAAETAVATETAAPEAAPENKEAVSDD